jgi:hypothetical protein
VNFLTESLETLHDLYKPEKAGTDAEHWESILACIKERRKLQAEVRSLLVEDALFRRAIGGDVRACLTWLKFNMPENWSDKHKPDFFADFTDPNIEIDELLDNPVESRDGML